MARVVSDVRTPPDTMISSGSSPGTDTRMTDTQSGRSSAIAMMVAADLVLVCGVLGYVGILPLDAAVSGALVAIGVVGSGFGAMRLIQSGRASK